MDRHIYLFKQAVNELDEAAFEDKDDKQAAAPVCKRHFADTEVQTAFYLRLNSIGRAIVISLNCQAETKRLALLDKKLNALREPVQPQKLTREQLDALLAECRAEQGAM